MGVNGLYRTPPVSYSPDRPLPVSGVLRLLPLQILGTALLAPAALATIIGSRRIYRLHRSTTSSGDRAAEHS
jgi:hypothetical protein